MRNSQLLTSLTVGLRTEEKNKGKRGLMDRPGGER